MRNLTQILSYKQISQLSNISTSTVVRMIHSCSETVEVNTY